MSDTTTRLVLPCLLAAQARTHRTHSPGEHRHGNDHRHLRDGRRGDDPRHHQDRAPRHGRRSGPTTVVNIGSATARAGGTTVVNTATVTFAKAARPVGMPHAPLTAQPLRLGGATADCSTPVPVNTPAVLLNKVAVRIEAPLTKAAAGNDAAFAYRTGVCARALIGLPGRDDVSFQVSPEGSAFFDAIRIDRTNGRVELPQPTALPGLSAAPTPPPAGKTWVYARSRAGAPWIEVMRPSGRDFPLQPHFGRSRIATGSPSVTATITTEGVSVTSVGTGSHPTLAATSLAASMRRWRLTLAAVVDPVADPVADQRSAVWPAGTAIRRASADAPS
jgi:hypothetical protein